MGALLVASVAYLKHPRGVSGGFVYLYIQNLDSSINSFHTHRRGYSKAKVLGVLKYRGGQLLVDLGAQ
jgi:hypothetical protein